MVNMNDLFNEIKRLQKEMNKLFDRFSGFKDEDFIDNKHIKFREAFSDLKETQDELIINIELPGVDKKDIQLLITENSLEIKVEKRNELKIKKKNYSREEHSYRGFHRKISLPVKIIPEDVESKYENGILEIRIPKAEKKKLKKIQIR